MDSLTKDVEKEKIGQSKIPEELRFNFTQLGLSDEVKTQANNEQKFLPHSTLPLGLPPLLPDVHMELEQFLLDSRQLPIHSFQLAQRTWNREKHTDLLFECSHLPPPTVISMERDPISGQLQRFKERFVSEVGLTAQNSMSMNRKPGPITNSVKGEASNRPFWPGGMPLPDTTADLISDQQPFHEKDDYLKRPPGFESDITFDEEPKLTVTDSMLLSAVDETINISDILSTVVDLTSLYVDVNERREQTTTMKESPVDLSLSVDEDISHNDLETANEASPALEEKETERAWAQVDSTETADFHTQVTQMAFEYPFELDTFQKRAVLRLERHENVLVAAHTSAGKTVVAEYAIALAQKHMRRAIYTSPIKALSNQKFRDFKQTFPEVGLLTGDVQIKPESSCLIMTTEILRSMLYNGSDVIRDVEWVIFDEIHYINDVDRGVVWEEVLIMLPSHVGIILLSATVPNTLEFASWIGRTKQKEVYVIQTKRRPVPLEHFLYTGNSNKTSNELFCVLDRKGQFRVEGYRAAVQAKKDRTSKVDEAYGAKGARKGNPKMDRSVWLSLLCMLKKKEQLPVVAFTLSKKKCDANADQVRTIDFVTSTERSHITTFFNKSLQRLKGLDRELPQVLWLEELLKNGIGVHHSGILPILKEIVEMLFSKGLLKILFATETFAMGVNMPARTVVFDSTRKFDGANFRDLLSSEYIQMAGRAGRRGLDTTGTVIVLCKGDVPETSDLHKMMLGTPTKLSSQFRLTYYMILNLLRVKQLTVQDMMKRSFAEYYLQKDTPENEKKLAELREQVKGLREPNCSVCSQDLHHYYLCWVECHQLKTQVKTTIFSSTQCVKLLVPGRLVLITNARHTNALGVLLQTGGLGSQSRFKNVSSAKSTPLERIYTVLVLCDKQSEGQDEQNNSNDGLSHLEIIASHGIFVPQGQCGQVVEELMAMDILDILSKQIKFDFDKVVENHKKRLIPRFRLDPPSQTTVISGQQLFNLTNEFTQANKLPVISPQKDLNLNAINFVEKYKRLENLTEKLQSFKCLECPAFNEHLAHMRANMRMRGDVQILEHMISDESLDLIQEYNQRVEVLKRLNYIDNELNLQHKGRVAFEISTHEVMITELLINNLLTDLHPAEIVALLSCFVFEQKTTSPPSLTPNLTKAVESVKDMAGHVARVQKDKGLDVTEDEFVRALHFGLVEVVHEWACGTPFKDVMRLTGVSEGNIVRCIQRLDETCRDVRKAAHVIGVQTLCDKMEEGMSLIRRDIVFAASLYTS